jgi:phosphoribosylformimino-5-aminoimidazole carboxamide ribotide isomerase
VSQHAPFELYPAIDVLGGRCVRLTQGDYAAKTEYSDNPRQVAERWLAAGSRWLHVVDLDGAKTGSSVNAQPIAEVIQAAREVGAQVQVGGGIREFDAIDRWLSAGASRCIIGTRALDTAWMEAAVRRFGADALVAGLDGRGGRVAVRGWIDQTDIGIVDIARQLADVGVRWALVTDVERDGTLTGANLELARDVQERGGLFAIASGGVRSLDDILAARAHGLAGAIVGRALYDGTMDLAQALSAVAEGDADRC